MKILWPLLFFAFTFSGFSYEKNDKIKDSLLYSTSSSTIKTKKFKSLDNVLKTSSYSPEISEFNSDYIKNNFILDDITNDHIAEAIAVINDLETSQNYIDLISPDDLVTLPVGVKKEIGNLTYIMGISDARFTPEYTEVTAFVRIVIPQLDEQGNQKQLFFGANNIKLSHQGGIYGEANLVLLGDAAIPINGGNNLVVLKGGFDMQTGNIEQETYATIDCSGFKELGIAADVIFSRNMLEPVDTNYKVISDTSQKVKGSFKATVEDWNDILVEINLPAFQLTKNNTADGSGKAGLVFELNTAVFDFSDVNNSSDVVFPDGYDQYLIPGNENAWRGVYVNSLKVVLPKQFKKRDDTERVFFEASNLLIDGMGVSADFTVDHILPLHEGEASKWQFSVDHIEAKIVTNDIVSAAFDGKIVLPVTDKVTESDSQDSETLNKKGLKYTALIDPVNDEYQLTVETENDISFNVFKAQATLTKNSYIELKVEDNKFKPKAVLHGSLTIRGSNSTNPDKATVDFKGVTFEKLQLQSEAPYFQVDYMGYSGEIKFANFPVTISDIGVTASDDTASLHFGIDVNLMSKGFAGGTDLEIVGKFGENDGLQHWKFDRIKVNRISVKADMGAIKIDGFVDIREDDPVYGDGFYGEVSADFVGIKVDVTACFGKTDFRYWYLDAYVDLSNAPTKVYIGPVIVNGFGGGAYYHMGKAPGTYSAGIPSGQSYVPDRDTYLGFRALIGFALGNEKALNGKVGFELAFNNNGGLNRVMFFGEAHIVKALDFGFGDQFKDKMTAMEDKVNSLGADNAAMNKLKETNLVDYSKLAFPQDGLTLDIGIDANFSMEMDFQNKVFHAEMEVFVNTPGNIFSGVGEKGRAGWAVFHCAPKEWYLHMGTPTDPVGLQIGLGGASLQVTSYLMVGDKIPGSPPPPQIVADILGVDMDTLDYMRDLNQLGEGSGFAFGMSLSVDTGNMGFLMLYARFQVGLGFDIMLKDYGETACKSSGQIGIDGWYANGQAYAYLQGELGIRIKLLGKEKKAPILTAGAAILLQAKLPNPAWFRGYVGGYYNVLGGLAKGEFNFMLELGQECELVNTAPLDGVKIISNIKPKNESSNVDVFAVPQVAFNMKINEAFQFEDDEGIGTYRILLDELLLSKEGTPIEGKLEWNSNNDVANFISTEILPPNSSLHFVVKVSFQQRQSGTWVTLKQDGEVAQEIEEITFQTGEAPNYIPISNIEYCYPVIDQDNFYQNETSIGYIQLDRGQSYLFGPETDWKQRIEFTSDIDFKQTDKVVYNQAEKKVTFDIPDVSNQREYQFRMVSYPINQEVQEYEEEEYVSQETGQEGNTVELLNKQAQDVAKDGVEIEMLAYTIKTSAYNTFKQKIDAKVVSQYFLVPINTLVHTLITDVAPSERFSILELNGSTYTEFQPLVATEAILDDSYYNNTVYPLVYQGYPLEPEFTLDRDTKELGVPPTKAMHTITWYSTYLESQPSYSLLDIRIPFRYNLPYHYIEDFYNIRYKIANKYLGNTSKYQSQIQKYNYIINGEFKAITPGYYNVKMQYVLPGGTKGTSSIMKFKNPNI
ncbi:hypothetical protein [Aquimarina pacifica]|uniref:hypothetical protein n=1 Tax=Aquimarina pacifica TaxID=1296415 RepID=UPI0004715E7E|nr:hypothetical protein [Aquimarina pacifica]